MLKNVFHKTPIFVPFIMAGAPSIELSIEAIIALSQVGSDLIEIGVPFTDPVADGAVNQRAAQISLQNGVTLEGVLDMVNKVRSLGVTTPIVLFSYFNPILSMGPAEFVSKAKSAGVDGVLIVDLPAEEGIDIYGAFREAKLDIVLLASPTTDPTRLNLYHHLEPAFIYFISRCGVTGAQNCLASELEQQVLALRQRLPKNQKIVVGFGISTVIQAKQVAKFADGVVIGSQLVRTLEEDGSQVFKELAQGFAMGIKER